MPKPVNDEENCKNYLAEQARKAGLGHSPLTRSDREAVQDHNNKKNHAKVDPFSQNHWITQNADGTMSLSRTYGPE